MHCMVDARSLQLFGKQVGKGVGEGSDTAR